MTIRREATRVVIQSNGVDGCIVKETGVLAAGTAGVSGNDVATVGQIGLSKYYESAAFTDYAAGGTKTLTHTLEMRPKNIQIYLRCTTAINGFVVGEEVLVGSQVSDNNVAAQHRGPQISSPDTSTVRIVYGGNNAFVLYNTSGVGFQPSAANFEAFVRAWA